MTVLSAPTRVRASAGGRLTAQCRVCDVHYEQSDGSEVAAALEAFDRHHPSADGAPHRRAVPAGWRAPLSWPGALSQ